MAGDAEALLARLRAYCCPDEAAARQVRGIRNAQRGEFLATPGGRSTSFTAAETMDATRSSFRWQARMQTGAMKWLEVTDAYEQGHGRLALRLGGIITVRQTTGPEVDQGELQRYLACVMYCPPILLNHVSLECTAVGPLTLRLHDRQDPTGASVDLELDENGRPTTCRAVRPRMAGSRLIPTPWWAAALDDRDVGGIRVPSRFESGWQLPEGPFTYIRGEFTNFEFVR